MITVNYVSLDITKAKTEAVVNSVGLDTYIYGAICHSIVEASKSDELRSVLKSKLNHVSIGDIFETPGYALPAKRIINVVSPYRYKDKDGSALKNTITNIFEYCLEKGIKSVTIAPIGAGANGYSRNFSYWTIADTALDFVETHKEGDLAIEITLYEPKTDQANRRARKMYSQRMGNPYQSEEESFVKSFDCYDLADLSEIEVDTLSFSAKQDESKVPLSECIDASYFNPSKIMNLYDYVSQFIIAKEKRDKEPAKEQRRAVYMFIGSYDNEETASKNGSNVLTAYKKRTNMQPNNRLLFLIAMALDMNKFETHQLFQYHRAALSPISQEDIFFRKWINRRDGQKVSGSYDHGQVWLDIKDDYERVLGKSMYPKNVGRKKTKKDEEDE